MRAIVVVPARDEEARIVTCLRALGAQEGLTVGSAAVVVVLDACTDATAAVARATADAVGLPLELVDGPGRGVGHARALGMERAAARLRAAARPRAAGADAVPVIVSTDADTVVPPDWLARILAAVDGGAHAVGGRIGLDEVEAAKLPEAVLRARSEEAARRLVAVRRHTPDATHHQFSGACLALTLAAYDAVGGLPATVALEDEALERALRTSGIAITYAGDVSVTTSARTDGHVARGLAQVLRTASWRATTTPNSWGSSGNDPGTGSNLLEPPGKPPGEPQGVGRGVTVVRARAGQRGDALHRALPGADELVLMLGPGVGLDAAQALLDALRDDPGLQLARGAEPHPDTLAELVVRPALNLHVPELAVLTSPLGRTWAARRTLLETVALPHGDAVDLTVLLDAWTAHGLQAIAERPVTCPAPGARADGPLAAYELLAALAARHPEQPVHSSAFADPSGTRRALLDEHAPRAVSPTA